MDINVPSAAAAIYHFGVDDQSTTVVPRLPITAPQHLPKVFSFTKTGPEEETLVTAAEMLNLYHAESFDLRSKYTTHQSPLIAALASQGNMMMFKRIVPGDAAKAKATLYVDIIPTTVDNYKRSPLSGAFELDANSDPIIDPVVASITGYEMKFVYDNNADESMSSAGSPTVSYVPGNMTVGGVTSKRYAIASVVHSFKTADGDNTAFRIWPQSRKYGNVLPSDLMDKEKAYPFNFALLKRADAESTYTLKGTISGAKQVGAVLKPAVYDKLTGRPMAASEGILPLYRRTDDPRYAKIYGEVSQITFHQANIDHILGLLTEAEKEAQAVSGQALPGCEFTTAAALSAMATAGNVDGYKYLYNLFGLSTADGAPYRSVTLVDDIDAVSLSESTHITLSGGSDGTLVNLLTKRYDATFDTKVREYMEQYADPDSYLQDLARNMESEVYDTGFSEATKYAIGKIILLRKDTICHLSTFVDQLSTSVSTAMEESDPLSYHLAMGMTLRNYLKLMPESEYFATAVCRATLKPGSYLLRNSNYKRRASPMIDYALKRAKYMGAADGYWREDERYDGAPGSILELGYDVRPEFVPKSQTFNAWDLGLVFPTYFDYSSYHIPVWKTVYDNDTSILNSDMIISAIAYINKVVAFVDRELKGIEGIKPAELADMYNKKITARLKGRFGSKYRITPMAQFSSMDVLRGYSITVPVRIEGSVPNSVMMTYVVAMRYQDTNQ